MILGKEHRRHPRLYLVAVALRDRQKFDHKAHLARDLDVRLGDLGDAFARDQIDRKPLVERERRQYRQLVAGIVTLDVRDRVRLGIAERLRVFEHLGIVRALLGHLAEDVVGRAVDDRLDLEYGVGLHRLSHNAYDRHAAARRRLIVETRARLRRRLFEVDPALGEHLLVGGDDALAREQRLGQEGLGRLQSAHALDDDVDVRIVANVVDAVGDDALVKPVFEHLFLELVEHRNDGEIDAVFVRDLLLFFEKYFERAASYNSQSEYRYSCFFHIFLLAPYGENFFFFRCFLRACVDIRRCCAA